MGVGDLSRCIVKLGLRIAQLLVGVVDLFLSLVDRVLVLGLDRREPMLGLVLQQILELAFMGGHEVKVCLGEGIEPCRVLIGETGHHVVVDVEDIGHRHGISGEVAGAALRHSLVGVRDDLR